MYRLDWIEQLKLRTTEAPGLRQVSAVPAPVWKLGWTSFLTDISSEMVNSVLPVYLVLHLHLNPLAYGAVDGLYNGFAVALLSLLSGWGADRGRLHKAIAVAGYGLSAVCKIALLAAGSTWSAIVGIIVLDRAGKGIRTAPRDALISLHARSESLASAFAAHRALDAGGMLLGPLVAYWILSQLPGAYDVVWLVSFAIAVVGVAVLVLFVPHPPGLDMRAATAPSLRATFRLVGSPRIAALALCGFGLSLATVSDAFLYLQLQRKTGLNATLVPLCYVLTACFYMLLSYPAGRIADRFGRLPVFLSGYVILPVLYLLLQSLASTSLPGAVAMLAAVGAYYALTEGILMAIASANIPAEYRTSGLAFIATAVAFGKLGSSLLFGYAWHNLGPDAAMRIFAVSLAALSVCAVVVLARKRRGQAA